MSANLIVAAFWMEGKPDDCTRAVDGAVHEAGCIPHSGAVVSISEREVLKLGYLQLRRDLATFQLCEAAEFWLHRDTDAGDGKH